MRCSRFFGCTKEIQRVETQIRIYFSTFAILSRFAQAGQMFWMSVRLAKSGRSDCASGRDTFPGKAWMEPLEINENCEFQHARFQDHELGECIQ